MVWSMSPRRNVARTKRRMSRSIHDRRWRPISRRSGRSSEVEGSRGRGVEESARSDICEDDVDITRRGQVRADGVEDVIGQVLVIDVLVLGTQLQRRMGLEIAFRIVGAEQLVARKLR